MEHKRHFDAKTTDMTRNERFLLIPNFTEAACEVIKALLDPENPRVVHTFMSFDQSDSSNKNRPGIIDLGQNIEDVDKKAYIGTIIDVMPYVKNGCVIIKTQKSICDIIDRLNFDMIDFAITIEPNPYDKSMVITINMYDPKSCKCCSDGRNEFRFVYDKGKPFWM